MIKFFQLISPFYVPAIFTFKFEILCINRLFYVHIWCALIIKGLSLRFERNVILQLSKNAQETICIVWWLNDFFLGKQTIPYWCQTSFLFLNSKPMENWGKTSAFLFIDFKGFWASRCGQIVDTSCQLHAERVLCKYFWKLALKECSIVYGTLYRVG